MSAFSDYEREVIEILVGEHFPAETVAAIIDAATHVSYEHTGIGYFLTVRHPVIPRGRLVCSAPLLTGRFGEDDCGFVCFIEHGELTLECHSWGDGPVPEDIRSRAVRIERGPSGT